MPFSIRPLSSVIGAEAVGFDPRDFTDADRDALQQAWYQHLVMLIRTPKVLSDDEFVGFMSRMGQIENARKLSPLSTRQEVMIISNIRENGELVGALPDGELSFHFDRVHQKKPTRATVLHAIEIPDKGGETCFANMYAAYDALPDTVKKKIDGRRRSIPTSTVPLARASRKSTQMRPPPSIPWCAPFRRRAANRCLSPG